MLRAVLGLMLSVFGLSGFAAANERSESGTRPVDNGWSLSAGGGSFLAPNYSGDDDYMVMAVPFIRVTKGDRFFASVQEGAGYTVLKQNGIEIGPVLTLDMGRDEDNGPFQIAGKKNTDLIGFGDIDPAIALGGFANYELGDIKFRSKIGKALGVHKGVSGEIGMDYQRRIFGAGPPLFIGFGPSAKFADSKYMQTFYGVTANQSAATGLGAYQPGGGLVSYGVGGSVMMLLTQKSTFRVFGSYDRLTGDAAKSPLVTERGSADQFFTGAVVAYRFF